MRRIQRPAHDTTTDRLATGVAPSIRATGWLAAAWCLGFAIVNVALESSHRFEDGPFARYATGLAVMSWVVFCLKLVGAGIALAAIRSEPPAPVRLVAALLWGAAALLGLYTLGSLVEALGMLTQLAGSRNDITFWGVLYVLFFALGALAYTVLAVSFARRFHTPRRTALVGVVGAPAALGLLLGVAPRLLVAVGVMPSY